MKNALWLILIFSSFFAGRSVSTAPKQPETIRVVNECPLLVYEPDTVYIPKDTMYVNISDIFKSRLDIELFIKYVKTQSHECDDDNWAVIKAMRNRLVHANVTFSEYFNDRNINHSRTIAKIRAGEKVRGFTFSWDNPMDIELVKRTLDVYYGAVPSYIDTVIVDNIRAFESHPKEWNINSKKSGVFDRKNIVCEYKHEFYRVL